MRPCSPRRLVLSPHIAPLDPGWQNAQLTAPQHLHLPHSALFHRCGQQPLIQNYWAQATGETTLSLMKM